MRRDESAVGVCFCNAHRIARVSQDAVHHALHTRELLIHPHDMVAVVSEAEQAALSSTHNDIDHAGVEVPRNTLAEAPVREVIFEDRRLVAPLLVCPDVQRARGIKAERPEWQAEFVGLGEHAPRRVGLAAIEHSFATVFVSARRARHAPAVKEPASYTPKASAIERSDDLRTSCVPHQEARSAVAPMRLDDDQVAAVRVRAEIPHPRPGRVDSRVVLHGDLFQRRAIRVDGVPAIELGVRRGFVRIADAKYQPLVTDPLEVQYIGIHEIRDWPGGARVYVEYGEPVPFRTRNYCCYAGAVR